jgi:hypothetical protein
MQSLVSQRLCAYAFDELSRLTSKTYSDSTPTASFSYDQSSVTTGSWSSGTLATPKGRLTEATTTSGSSVTTGLVYSYDPVGRTKNFWQCNPANCGTSTIYNMTYLSIRQETLPVGRTRD